MEAPATPTLEWYQIGNWPLFGAVAVIIISHAVSVGLIYLKSMSEMQSKLQVSKIDFMRMQLAELHDPLMSFLALNRYVFRWVGPPSFPESGIEYEAALTIWKRVRTEVIVQNNIKIRAILEEKSYLIYASDSLDKYLELLLHVQMYSIFQDMPTDLYAKFTFPERIYEHVRGVRAKLIDELSQLTSV